MGLTNEYLNFFDTNIKNLNLTNPKMLELGDQVVSPSLTGKQYYTSLDYDHISVDLNGANGSLIKDLRYPKEFNHWNNYFDIITNAGTTEHVEPIDYQYDCFSIIHDCLKVGGIQLHVVPCIEGLSDWANHCTIYYSIDFFNMLSKTNSYELIEIKLSSNNLLMVCLKKTNPSEFTKDKNVFNQYLHVMKENLKYDQDASSKLKN
jgi:hypothetical protein